MSIHEKKECCLIGIGMGNPKTLTREAFEIINNSSVIAGAARILQSLPDSVKVKKIIAVTPQKIIAAFENSLKVSDVSVPVACFSGDAGFYSGATNLIPLLRLNGWNVHVIPGITTAQYLASKLGVAWQDWRLVSVHGVSVDEKNLLRTKDGKRLIKEKFLCTIIGPAFAASEKTFFLTGGKISPDVIVLYLASHGQENAKVTVAYNLSYDDEKIISGSASEVLSAISNESSSLAAVLVERTIPDEAKGTGALCDDFFGRIGEGVIIKNRPVTTNLVPMTKQFVRSSILSLINAKDSEVIWDIGAGTGAVTVDIARSARCAVYAVEKNNDACLAERLNCKKAGIVNVEFVCGHAPESLSNLPAPDAVFAGGADGCLSSILKTVFRMNKNARVVVSAVTPETLAEALSYVHNSQKKLSCSVSQISAAQSVAIEKKKNSEAEEKNTLHLMKAQNPVWLIAIKSAV
jgi:precorrin-6Y C5,15-methyltransferase (decarboxylating)